jgi:hypothetical protein
LQDYNITRLFKKERPDDESGRFVLNRTGVDRIVAEFLLQLVYGAEHLGPFFIIRERTTTVLPSPRRIV